MVSKGRDSDGGSGADQGRMPTNTATCRADRQAIGTRDEVASVVAFPRIRVESWVTGRTSRRPAASPNGWRIDAPQQVNCRDRRHRFDIEAFRGCWTVCEGGTDRGTQACSRERSW